METNKIILKELIKRGYTEKNGSNMWNIRDSKLWYLNNKQAQAFLDLKSSETYVNGIIIKEVKLIDDNIKEILETIGDNINIVDIASRDGRKANRILKHLTAKKNIKYYPVDTHKFMTDKAIQKIQNLNVVESSEAIIVESFLKIENIGDNLTYPKTVFLLLGNNLGNFEINEMLYEARKIMKDEDLLIIGNGIDNENDKESLKAYTSKQINDFFIEIPKQLGFSEEDLEFGLKYENSRVQIFYTIKNNFTIKEKKDTIEFKKGETFTVLQGDIGYKARKADIAWLNQPEQEPEEEPED